MRCPAAHQALQLIAAVLGARSVAEDEVEELQIPLRVLVALCVLIPTGMRLRRVQSPYDISTYS